MKFGGVCLAAALTAAAGAARADRLDDAAKKLVSLEAEAQSLASSIQKPRAQPPKEDEMSRRLIDAQVSFGVGDFDSAALLLYDYVAQKPRAREYDTALYYLGEALFQKGDRLGARKSFAQLTNELGQGSKYYQQALERLIELSLILDEHEGSADGSVTQWMAELDAIPHDRLQPSTPYIRGKYAFSQGKYDDAIRWFQQISQQTSATAPGAWVRPSVPGSTTSAAPLAFQAAYYIGASHVAKHEFDKAAQAFEQVLKREAKTPDEQRIAELSQLALGRLYYEQDQPTKALDTYLLIDRKSDLFPVVLYEVAWLYVKSKQYDKALRALELLALADPMSQQLPTVRLLEGNLRIRKAQSLHEKIVGGIQIGTDLGLEEYLKADELFQSTHELYAVPHSQLAHIIEAHDDPQNFLAQITRRSSSTFQTQSTMPEIAAAWVREEPEIGRVMNIETDLGTVGLEIAEAERTIFRLEAALVAPNRVNLFPTLASKRVRSTEIFDEILALREQLATEERALAKRAGTDPATSEAVRNTRTAATRIAELPEAGESESKRIDLARDAFDELEHTSSETMVTVTTTRATMVAIDKFLKESQPPAEPVRKATWESDRTKITSELGDLENELRQIESELDNVRREIVLGRDRAGYSDESSLLGESLRSNLRDALASEHAALATPAGRADGTRAGKIDALIRRSDAVLAQLDGVNRAVADIVEGELVEVRQNLERERAELAAYRREFLLYEAESRELGGSVLAEAFRTVKDKLYDILVRTDVGVVDVTWSQKEEADDDLRRLNLDKQREIRHLKDEFSDLMREAREQAAQAPAPTPATTPSGAQP